ncbi:MAG: hypothetical protein U5J78_00215 [Parasphingorhabdus sp.]|nr:hypothetical protein [Parasphingorhabdus sp.]
MKVRNLSQRLSIVHGALPSGVADDNGTQFASRSIHKGNFMTAIIDIHAREILDRF